jgi:hypothetical protein
MSLKHGTRQPPFHCPKGHLHTWSPIPRPLSHPPSRSPGGDGVRRDMADVSLPEKVISKTSEKSEKLQPPHWPPRLICPCLCRTREEEYKAHGRTHEFDKRGRRQRPPQAPIAPPRGPRPTDPPHLPPAPMINNILPYHNRGHPGFCPPPHSRPGIPLSSDHPYPQRAWIISDLGRPTTAR